MKTTERIPVDFTWSAKTEPDHCRVFALMSTTAKSVAQQWRHTRRFFGNSLSFRPPQLYPPVNIINSRFILDLSNNIDRTTFLPTTSQVLVCGGVTFATK